jgi:hypothetical protein
VAGVIRGACVHKETVVRDDFRGEIGSDRVLGGSALFRVEGGLFAAVAVSRWRRSVARRVFNGEDVLANLVDEPRKPFGLEFGLHRDV